jgi:cysteine desulfurase
METMPSDIERMARLRERMVYAIMERDRTVRVNGPRHHRLCNNANMLFPDVDAQQLVLRMDKAGYAISTGSACHTKNVSPSHVLLAIGLDAKQASSAIRISMSRYTTSEEIDGFVEALPAAVDASRRR